MSSQSTQIRLNPGANATVCYCLCGQLITVNQAIKALSAFKVEQETETRSSLKVSSQDSKQALQNLFNGTSWLAGQDREISSWRCQDGFIIRVPDASDFFVSDDGTLIQQLNEVTARFSSSNFEFSKISTTGFEQILLGPPLMLSLALKGFFALHASSVLINDKAVLFVGESGFGKSTIASWLDSDAGCRRLSDDISVIQKNQSSYQLMTDFPQMKLKDDQQLINTNPLELSAVVLLKRDKQSSARLRPMQALDAMRIGLNHSVAAQLFDKQLAKDHLAFICELTTKIPTYTLEYPSGRENMSDLAALLKQQLN